MRNNLSFKANHHPFGSIMSGRGFNAGTGKFGFNGMLKDDEVKGTGNSLDFGARIYDSRLGRWMSVDPMNFNQPSWSPFKSNFNNPIFFIDKGGLTEYSAVKVILKDGTEMTIKQLWSNKIMTDGVKYMSGGSANWHYVYKYFNYTTQLTLVQNSDGTFSHNVEVIFDRKNSVDEDYAIWDAIDQTNPFDTKDWGPNCRGGIEFTSKHGRGINTITPNADDKTVDIDDIIAALGGLSNGGIFKGGKLSTQEIVAAVNRLNAIIEKLGEAAEVKEDVDNKKHPGKDGKENWTETLENPDGSIKEIKYYEQDTSKGSEKKEVTEGEYNESIKKESN